MGGVHTKELKCSKCETRIYQPMDMNTRSFPKMDKCPKCGEENSLGVLRIYIRSTN